MPEEREDLCAAETEHEEEWGEDVDPEVDDDHHREDVDRLVALLGVRIHSHQPDRAGYQPSNLEDDVHWEREKYNDILGAVTWKDKYDNIVESFRKRRASFGEGRVEVVKKQIEQGHLYS